MLANLVDHRLNRYDTLVDVVIEPSCHDNTIAGATQHPAAAGPGYLERFRVSVGEAISWAQAQPGGPHTLFLYTQNTTHRAASRS